MERAHILLEALPYIREFYGKTVVIKYGGHAMVDEKLKESFARDVVLMKYIGINPIVVHGGGPQIGLTMKKMGKEPKFIDGLRVTDRETMDIVEMVLGGKVNKEIVALINKHGGSAVGLTGKDGLLFLAKKLYLERNAPQTEAPEIIDLGHVGEVTRVDPAILEILARERFIPVIAPIGVDEEGITYNINADWVASKIASAAKAERLIFMTDVDGVLDDNGNLISSMNRKLAQEMMEKGILKGGMIPKVRAGIDALERGVNKVHIVNGTIPHCIILELFTDTGIGTEIVL
ncbi:acetylglutamate kinase [Thermosulfidibacter takaii ABI70S6]|uniref:Acetylglutamate kinase n=1 Tax=Thermosulfidibacter takaii (strain DSM 17441 / JCM 13301 / NBRC 103674 / ABI70S6) TaxID=1298851 RepID=A0A0S3QW66_THET7|nr:acetylglutamate kinase [Thermosulfidibacter takaii ABI70S6]